MERFVAERPVTVLAQLEERTPVFAVPEFASECHRSTCLRAPRAVL
jgi:hypothetical protein